MLSDRAGYDAGGQSKKREERSDTHFENFDAGVS